MRLALLSEPGVLDAGVDWTTGEARITYDASLTDPQRLAGAPVFREPQAGGRHRYHARTQA